MRFSNASISRRMPANGPRDREAALRFVLVAGFAAAAPVRAACAGGLFPASAGSALLRDLNQAW